MITFPLRMLVVAIATLTMASCTSQWLPTESPTASPEAVKISNKLHRTINHYRANHGHDTIERHHGLDEIALDHTRYLLKRRGTSLIHGRNVTHIGSGWRSIDANRRFGMSYYGENVACIATNPDKPDKHLLLMWKTSFQHNETMLGNWTHTGIGVLIADDGAVFVTQVFGLKEPDEEAAPDEDTAAPAADSTEPPQEASADTTAS